MSPNFTHIILFHLQGSKVASCAWDNYTFLTEISPCASSPAARNPCGENNGGCEQVCVLSHRTDNGGLGYRCKCTFGFNLDVDGRHCVGKKLVLDYLSARWHRVYAALGLCQLPVILFHFSVAHRASSSVGPTPLYTELHLKKPISVSGDLPLSPQLGFPGLPSPFGSFLKSLSAFLTRPLKFHRISLRFFLPRIPFPFEMLAVTSVGSTPHHFCSPLPGCHSCHFESGVTSWSHLALLGWLISSSSFSLVS